MRKRQKIYDRTNDLKRLVKSLQRDIPASRTDEVSISLYGSEGSSQYGSHSSHLRPPAEELAQSIEQSLLMIGKLHVVVTSHLQHDFSDDSRKIINDLTERLNSHKEELEKISHQINKCSFSPERQIFHHYEAVKTTLRSRVMDVSRIFKNELTRQIRSISHDMSPSAGLQIDDGFTACSQQYACERISGKLPAGLGQSQVHEIEQAVLGLTEMMREVAHLVTEQEGLVKQIDFNVDMSMQEVMLGNLSLSRFSDAFKSRQRIIIRILMVVFVSILLVFGVGIV